MVVVGDQTQGFAHARQLFYHWAILPAQTLYFSDHILSVLRGVLLTNPVHCDDYRFNSINTSCPGASEDKVATNCCS
jgi:hypothetical protein